MSLYKNLINEALEEDQRANREVVERLRKNYVDNKEKMKEGNEISSYQLSIVQRLMNLLAKEVNTIIISIQDDLDKSQGFDLIEYVGNVSDTTLKYNNLSIYLKNINYNKLSKGSQSRIKQITNQILPSLITLGNYFNPENGFFYADDDPQLFNPTEEATNFEATINEIYNQISNGTYLNVAVLEDYESKDIRGREEQKKVFEEITKRERINRKKMEERLKNLRKSEEARREEERRRGIDPMEYEYGESEEEEEEDDEDEGEEEF
jgi:hypothetical protein